MTRLITQTQMGYFCRFGTELKEQICIEQVSRLYCKTKLACSLPNLFIHGSCFLNISLLLESKVKLLALLCYGFDII